MEIHNFDNLVKIIETQGEKTNPLLLLGVEPWVLRSLDDKHLKEFISTLKRVLAKIHHPDQYQDPSEKEKHQFYFKRLNDGVDKLLADDFYFRQCIGELRNEDVLHRYQDELSTEKSRSERLRKQVEELRLKTEGKNLVIDSYKRISHSLRNVESELTENTMAFPLVKGFGCMMNMGEYILEDVKLCGELETLFSSDKKGLDLELAGRILIRESF
jgi:hypothetical protein